MGSVKHARKGNSERLVAEVWDGDKKLAEADITHWSVERMAEFYRIAEIQRTRVELRWE